MLLDVIEHVMHVMHHVIDVITDQLQCIMLPIALHDITSSNIPLHACNGLCNVGVKAMQFM